MTGLSSKLDTATTESVEFLKSADAQESIKRDPYWPKWDSPWWHMTLLWEMGLADRIPASIVRTMVTALDRHYLKIFPTKESEIPAGVDPHRGTACHCALGTMYQVLSACGVDVDAELAWIRSWFLKYQLPDGGLNCDNEAYTKPTPKSSFVSTLPPLEAILHCTRRSFTDAEVTFLDRGAAYLLSHRLFRRSDSEDVVNEAWLQLSFPRFYNYDVLRGLSFLGDWAKRFGKTLPSDAIADAVKIIRGQLEDGTGSRREPWENGWGKSLFPTDGGAWEWREPTLFPLLREAETSVGSFMLTHKFRQILANGIVSVDSQERTC